MSLKIQKVLKYEVVHYADDTVFIGSIGNKVFYNKNEKQVVIQLPLPLIFQFLNLFRLARRALRLDKTNVFQVENGLIIIYQKNVYHYCFKTKHLKVTLILKNCRNVLHQSISRAGSNIYFGEYGNNKAREAVPVYRSLDEGHTWEEIFSFKPGKIKHVHGCYYDSYWNKIWVLTGDFAGENFMLVADLDFKHIEWLGDGSQKWRAVNLFFNKDKVDWIMDSQLEKSYHYQFDRKSKKISRKALFLGPVWYIKRLKDGVFLAATAQEIGPGVLDDKINLYMSKDLDKWNKIYQFEHDGLPKRFFKFGVVGFADGEQDKNLFYLFLEAVKKYDGKTLQVSVN